MQQTQTVSTNKLIFMLVFLCAAIMASVFVYHMSQQQTKMKLVNNENVLLFPVPRDIKPFELSTASNTPFTQNNLREHWTLLFFGFTHCSSVCPTTMDVLNKVYGKLHATYPNLQVALISLDPERDTRAALLKYVQSFNPDFIGASGKIEEIRKLQSQLGIYSARDSQAANYQIQHTPSVMLINPEGKWAGVFKFGMKPDDMAVAIQQSMNSSLI